jgi:hypothetical protein
MDLIDYTFAFGFGVVVVSDIGAEERYISRQRAKSLTLKTSFKTALQERKTYSFKAKPPSVTSFIVVGKIHE